MGLAKEELITVEGKVDEILPDARFGVSLDNEHRIIAYTAGKCAVTGSARSLETSYTWK